MTMKAGLHREKLYCRVFNLHQTMYVKLMEILLAPSLNWKVYTLNCSAEESNICGRMNAYLECGFQCLELSMIESLLKVPSQAGAPPLAT